MRSRVIAAGVLLWCWAAPGPVAAEERTAAESVALARELYGAAEYERALRVLDDVRETARTGGADVATVEQYRALCLMAVGKTSDAEQAMAALVLSEPGYRMDETVMSPRVRATFHSVRARTLPAAIQRQYDSAKAAFDRREFAVASVGFAGVLRLMADDDVKGGLPGSPLADLKTLAEGFRDLSTSASAPPPAPPVAAPAVVPRVPAPPVKTIYTADDPGVVGPVTQKQTLPSFPAQLIGANAGVLELLIDENGLVESASMPMSINPRYDKMLLEATKAWRYRPATRGGVPVKYRKLVQIAVRKTEGG